MSTQTRDRRDTSLAALFHGAGQLDLREVAIPSVRGGEALVRIHCCTICGSDLHTYTGARKEPTPSILGHEIVGVVEEVGDPPLCDISGSALQPNDRLTWSTSVACGSCDRCGRGMPQKCRNLSKYGHELAEGRAALSGGLAEYILLRRGTAAVKLDADIPNEVICPVNCATATVAAAFRTAGRIADQRVLIFGAGMLGLTAAAFAKSYGASRVVVCDPNAVRLDRALEFGADKAVPWPDDLAGLRRRLQTDGGPALFDVILELSGARAAVEAACEFGDVAAQLILVGTVMPCAPVRIDPEQIVRRWLSIRGVHNYNPDDLQTAIGFFKHFHTAFPFAQLVERTYPLRRVKEAIEMAVRDRPVRVAILPQRS